MFSARHDDCFSSNIIENISSVWVESAEFSQIKASNSHVSIVLREGQIFQLFDILEIVIFESLDILLPEFIGVDRWPLEFFRLQFFDVLLIRSQNSEVSFEVFSDELEVVNQILVTDIPFQLDINNLMKLRVDNHEFDSVWASFAQISVKHESNSDKFFSGKFLDNIRWDFDQLEDRIQEVSMRLLWERDQPKVKEGIVRKLKVLLVGGQTIPEDQGTLVMQESWDQVFVSEEISQGRKNDIVSDGLGGVSGFFVGKEFSENVILEIQVSRFFSIKFRNQENDYSRGSLLWDLRRSRDCLKRLKLGEQSSIGSLVQGVWDEVLNISSIINQNSIQSCQRKLNNCFVVRTFFNDSSKSLDNIQGSLSKLLLL